MKKLLKRYGFTLVELIVVVVILAVLASLAFMTVSKWIGASKDSRRKMDLSVINQGLTLYIADHIIYPDPDDMKSVKDSNGGTGWYQGTVGDSVKNFISGLKKVPKDPSGGNYGYSITTDKKKYQLRAITQGSEEISILLGDKLYADTYYAYLKGNYDGYLIILTGGKYNFYQIPSLFINETDLTESYTITTGLQPILQNNKSISGKFNVSMVDATSMFNGGDSTSVLSQISTTMSGYGTVDTATAYRLVKEAPGSNPTSFSAAPPLACGGIPSGNTNDFYDVSSVTAGNSCDPHKKTFTCNNGTWKDGESIADTATYQYTACIVGTPVNCEATTYSGYTISATNHGLSGNSTKDISENNGVFRYTQYYECNNGTFNYTAPTGPEYVSCNSGYYESANSCLAYVNGACTGLPSNSLYYNDTTSYTLVNAVNGTSFSAVYNATPTINTCQYKCKTNYIRTGGVCTMGTLDVSQVFSTTTYVGNGSTQTITNGIDLAGNGGMVWLKQRNGVGHQTMIDFKWGGSTLRFPNLTLSQSIANFLTYNVNGFTINSSDNVANGNSNTYSSWTFRESAKFFDEASATVNTDTTISFPELGTIGMVLVQGTYGNDSPFYIWHRSATTGKLLQMNSTAAEATSNAITVSGTDITLHSSAYDGGGLIVYAWAHDPTQDGIIQAGSFTTDASGFATVNLGWEPQYMMMKNSQSTGPWIMLDSIRGWDLGASTDRELNANSSSSEGPANYGNPLSNGFQSTNLSANNTYIYLAIRRPNKLPTTGTQVYNAVARTGNGATTNLTDVGFSPDLVIDKMSLFHLGGGGYSAFWDRLRGVNLMLISNTNKGEGATAQGLTIGNYLTSFDNNGITVGSDTNALLINSSSDIFINYFFRRAPGFFDILSYVGNGAGGYKTHGLGVVPEMIIFKNRNSAADWGVYHSGLGASAYTVLNSNAPAVTATFQLTNSTTPSSTQISVWNNAMNNALSNNYVAYLFATLPNISKVGSYVGNGTTQSINAGFDSTARFILIKRTDVAGDWFVWDSTRGIVAGNDPHLSLNSTAAEITTDDSVDPDSTGFAVNQVAATNINVSGGTYIYLAVH